MELNEIAEKVRCVVSQVLKQAVTTDQLRTTGLGVGDINSMTFLMIVTGIENAFDVEFDDDEISYGMIGDFNKLCVMIQKRLEISA